MDHKQTLVIINGVKTKRSRHINDQMYGVELADLYMEHEEPIILHFLILKSDYLRMLETYY